jgi:hypothetical protein
MTLSGSAKSKCNERLVLFGYHRRECELWESLGNRAQVKLEPGGNKQNELSKL